MKIDKASNRNIIKKIIIIGVGFITFFQNVVYGMDEVEFFQKVKEKREFFKMCKVKYKREFIKWKNFEDYIRFKNEIEQKLWSLNKDKLFKWYLKNKIREYRDGDIQDITSYYEYEDKYPYINKMHTIIYLESAKTKKNLKDACKGYEFLWEVNGKYREYCKKDGKSKLVKIDKADLKNLLNLGMGLGNFDFSLSPLERIKERSNYEFKFEKDFIIKTNDGELHFDYSKSLTAKKLISYSKENGEIIEEGLYGAYEKVGNYYLPFFIINTTFSDKIESSVVLIEKYDRKSAKEKYFTIEE